MQYFVFETFSVSRWIPYGSHCAVLWESFKNYADLTVEDLDWVDLGFISQERVFVLKTLVFHFFGQLLKNRELNLIKLRIFMNICLETNKNYEQLSSTISKFQALFSKLRALFEHFFATFWALFGEFSSAIATCLSSTGISFRLFSQFAFQLRIKTNLCDIIVFRFGKNQWRVNNKTSG